MDPLNTLRYRVANSSIGFDHLLDFFTKDIQVSPQSFPPYNIIKTGDQTYTIELAVAGFNEDELDIQVQENVLTVSGARKIQSETTYLHKGIAARDFTSRFTVADDVEVHDASTVNGLLVINLERKIPEHKKPKKISIRNHQPQLLAE
jgi:molecular chaperone IbpA